MDLAEDVGVWVSVVQVYASIPRIVVYRAKISFS